VALIETKRGVYATQAGACWGCLHVGWWAFYIWPTLRRHAGWRLEVLTPLHRWRWDRGAWR